MVNTQLLALLFLMWYVVDGKDGCCWVSSFWQFSQLGNGWPLCKLLSSGGSTQAAPVAGGTSAAPRQCRPRSGPDALEGPLHPACHPPLVSQSGKRLHAGVGLSDDLAERVPHSAARARRRTRSGAEHRPGCGRTQAPYVASRGPAPHPRIVQAEAPAWTPQPPPGGAHALDR